MWAQDLGSGSVSGQDQAILVRVSGLRLGVYIVKIYGSVLKCLGYLAECRRVGR